MVVVSFTPFVLQPPHVAEPPETVSLLGFWDVSCLPNPQHLASVADLIEVLLANPAQLAEVLVRKATKSRFGPSQGTLHSTAC